MGDHLDYLNRTAPLPQQTESALQRELAQRIETVVPWLDAHTARLVGAIVAAVAIHHPEAQAAILFGSIARHEERSLDDPYPSDVDLLLLIPPDPATQRIPHALEHALWRTIGDVQYRHRSALREAQITLVETTLADWDELFVMNVARDGILLWRRGESGAAGHAAPGNETQEAGISGAPLPDAWSHLA